MKSPNIKKAARKMPRLRHSIPGQDFDPQKSEVLTWLASQPKIMLALYDSLRYAGDIVFDPDTRTWAGADTARGGGQ